MLINELAETLDLNGTWQFAPTQTEDWDSILVPGCWEAQGYSKYLEGPVRYRRSVLIPAAWSDQQILLECAAVSYACRVFCNGLEVGQHLGLWTPFSIDLRSAIRPGEENQLEFEIYKPGKQYPTRSSLAGFLPDVATIFGGIWQPISMRTLSVALADLQIRADYETHTISVRAKAETFQRSLIHPSWKVSIFQKGNLLKEAAYPFFADGYLETALAFPEAQPWSPENPTLYELQVTLFSDDQPAAQATRSTGFRKLSADGAQLLLNGLPFMVRGILSWGWKPETVAPTYTIEQARTEMRKARAMGFNLIKLCLVIPNPAYFEVADQEGMLLWEELPMWLPEVNDQLRAQAPREYAEIAQLLASHPSVVLYSLGCELNEAVDGPLLGQLNQAIRGCVQDVLVCDNSGSGESYGGLDFDFADFTDYHPYYDLQFFDHLLDNWRRDWQQPRPLIFGEFCDSDTFRDLTKIITANDGHRPWWLTRDNPVTTWRSETQAALEWEERLENADPGFSFHKIVDVSYQQSYIVRKYTLESLRRRRGMGGYIITGMRDTPISTSGVWDDFDNPKWLPEAFRQINDEAVLMLDVVRRRKWQFGGDRPDRVDVFNHWAGDPAHWYVIGHDNGTGFPASSQLEWALTGADGALISSGAAALEKEFAPGIPQQLSAILVRLPEVSEPVQLRLMVQLSGSDRRVNNQWPVWVYPRPGELPADLVLFDPTGLLSEFSDLLESVPQILPSQPIPDHHLVISTSLNEQLWQALATGARVLLLQQGDHPLPVRRCPFWREGIKLFPDHPLWARFPQQGFSDMQFFGLACDLAFDTARLAGALPPEAEIRPILRRLDAREFHISEYLFQANVGSGVLLGCALRLQGGMGAQPSGGNRNIAGAAMLQALLDYLNSQPSANAQENIA